MTIVACAAWIGHLRWSSRGAIHEEDRDSTLRAVGNFAILLVSVLVTLFSASRVFYLLLTAAFHVDAPRWMGSRSLADGLIETLTYVLVFGMAWLLARRWLGTDALGAERERPAGVRRLYTHLVSFVGLLALASGASGLLWTLLDQMTSNGLAVRPDAWLDQASLFTSLLVVVLPLLDRACLVVHRLVRITNFRKTFRNREHGEVGGIAVGNFVPVKRRGNAGVGERAHGIRGARRTILGVLVIVEEHAVALLLPPFRTGQGGRAPLDST